MLNIFGRTKYKDYEETENIKNANEENETNLNYMNRINIFVDIKKIIIMICGFLFFICFLVFLYKSRFKTSNKPPLIIPPTPQPPVNPQIPQFQQKKIDQPIQQITMLNQQNQSLLQQNLSVQQQNQFLQPQKQYQVLQLQEPKKVDIYQIKQPLDLNTTKYLPFFPKIINEQSNSINVSKYFTHKRLYISGKNITYDYIHFIRQHDKDEEKNSQILFASELFKQDAFLPRAGQLSIKDFYKLCNQPYLDNVKDYNATEEPIISIIIPVYLTAANIVKTLRSIQNQSLKKIEIIIVDDVTTNYKNLYNHFFEYEPRIRIFTQLRSKSVWRKRLDGFLYSRGKYILHINPGDILADNFVLEDACNLVFKYSLDSVRFSFSKTKLEDFDDGIFQFGFMKRFPSKHLRIIYGKPDYDIHEFGYGTVWNRLIRANMITKGLDLIDDYIINSKKNLWEDMWWNDLIDRVSLSNLVVNRIGYIFFYNRTTVIEPKIRFSYQRDETIREFIYFWYFDYKLLPREDSKKKIIKTLVEYNMSNNTFCRLPMRIEFLKTPFDIYERLLQLLLDDPFVSEKDKNIVKELVKKYKELMKKNEEIRKREKESLQRIKMLNKKLNKTKKIGKDGKPIDPKKKKKVNHQKIK